jgi:hypothetical protein
LKRSVSRTGKADLSLLNRDVSEQLLVQKHAGTVLLAAFSEAWVGTAVLLADLRWITECRAWSLHSPKIKSSNRRPSSLFGATALAPDISEHT